MLRYLTLNYVNFALFSYCTICIIYPFKWQPHKMVKHTQTIRRQQSINCWSVFEHLVGLFMSRYSNVPLFCFMLRHLMLHFFMLHYLILHHLLLQYLMLHYFSFLPFDVALLNVVLFNVALC